MIYKTINIQSAEQNGVSTEFATEFIDHRINKKSKLTQRAFDRSMREAGKCRQLGITPDQAVEITIDCGWSGLVCEYVSNELQKRARAAFNSSGVVYEGRVNTFGERRLSRSELADRALVGATRSINRKQ